MSGIPPLSPRLQPYNVEQLVEQMESSELTTEQEEVSSIIQDVPIIASLDDKEDLVLNYLSIRDLLSLQKTCRYFNAEVKSYLKRKLDPTLDSYGFEPRTDPRNYMVVQKALEACEFEGEKGLALATLTNKMQVVLDRNLIRIYLLFFKGLPKVMPQLEWSHTDQELFQALNKASCLTQITNISRTADLIRIFLKEAEEKLYIRTLKLPAFDPSREQDNSRSRNRHITVIPPEIAYFRTSSIYAYYSCLMLIPRNIAKALVPYEHVPDPANEHIGGSLDIRFAQLGTVPVETHHLFCEDKDWDEVVMRCLGGMMERTPVLEQQQDTNPVIKTSFL